MRFNSEELEEGGCRGEGAGPCAEVVLLLFPKKVTVLQLWSTAVPQWGPGVKAQAVGWVVWNPEEWLAWEAVSG